MFDAVATRQDQLVTDKLKVSVAALVKRKMPFAMIACHIGVAQKGAIIAVDLVSNGFELKGWGGVKETIILPCEIVAYYKSRQGW